MIRFNSRYALKKGKDMSKEKEAKKERKKKKRGN